MFLSLKEKLRISVHEKAKAFQICKLNHPCLNGVSIAINISIDLPKTSPNIGNYGHSESTTVSLNNKTTGSE